MNLTEAYARVDHILPGLPGWCTPEKGRRLAQLVCESRARKCVELGVFGGRSLVAMGLGLAVNGFGEVAGLDPFEKGAALEGANSKENEEWWSKLDYEDIMRSAVAGIERNALGPYASIVRAKSLDPAVLARFEPGSVDVMHQDSNHSEEVSCAEVRAWAPKIALGGFWVSDDVDWATTKRSQELLQSIGFKLVEPHPTWAIFQAVGSKLITEVG